MTPLRIVAALILAAGVGGCSDGHDYDIKTDGTNYYVVSRFNGHVFSPDATLDAACKWRDRFESPNDVERAKREQEQRLLKERAKSWRSVTCE